MKFNITCTPSLTSSIIVRNQLDKHQINYDISDAGEFTLKGEMPADFYSTLQSSLKKYSIELLQDEKSQLVQRIKNLLSELAYSDKPSLTLSVYLAQKLGYSYGYISYIFTNSTLTSIENYLIMLRIERAKRLIIEDVVTLKEISSLLHYSSIGHFSRQFKKTTGLTISVFKKIVENKRRKPSVIYQYKK